MNIKQLSSSSSLPITIIIILFLHNTIINYILHPSDPSCYYYNKHPNCPLKLVQTIKRETAKLRTYSHSKVHGPQVLTTHRRLPNPYTKLPDSQVTLTGQQL